MATIDRDDPSSKKSNQFENTFDTQSLDSSKGAYSNFSMDFEGFDDEKDRAPDSGKKGRFSDVNWNSIGRRAGAGAAHGIAAALANQLPKTSEMVQDVKEFSSDLSQMKNEISSQLGPMIRDSKVVGSRVLPKAKGLLPEGLYKKLEEALRVDEESPAYDPKAAQAQRRKDQMQSSLDSIFKANVELQMNAQRQAAVDRIVDQKVEGVRHAQIATELDAIKRQTYFHTNFLRSTYVAYMQKDLQLKYQMLYTQEDILTANKVGFQQIGVALEKIRHNTGLPDIVKKKSLEAAKEALYGKMYQSLASKVTGIGGKLLKGVKERYIDPTLNTASMMLSMGDSATSMLDMMDDGENSATTLLKHLFGWGAKGAVKRIATRALDKGVSPQIKEYIESTFGDTRNIPLILESIRRNDGKLPPQLEGLAKIPGFGKVLAKLAEGAADLTEGLKPEHTRIRNKALEDPNGAGTITNRFTTTVEQIIPGYLRLQTRYLEAIATGVSPDSVDEVVFHKGQLTRSQTARASLMSVASAKSSQMAAARAIDNIKTNTDWNNLVKAGDGVSEEEAQQKSQALRDDFVKNQTTIAQIMSNMAATRSWESMNTRGKTLLWLKNFVDEGDAAINLGNNDDEARAARRWQEEVFKGIEPDVARTAAKSLLNILQSDSGTRGMIQSAIEAGVKDIMMSQASQQERLQKELSSFTDWNGLSTSTTANMFDTKNGLIDTSSDGTVLSNDFLDRNSVDLRFDKGSETFDKYAGGAETRYILGERDKKKAEIQEALKTGKIWDPALGSYRKLTKEETLSLRQQGWAYGIFDKYGDEKNDKSLFGKIYRGTKKLGDLAFHGLDRTGDFIGNHLYDKTKGLQQSLMDKVNPDAQTLADKQIRSSFKDAGSIFDSAADKDLLKEVKDTLLDKAGNIKSDLSMADLEKAFSGDENSLKLEKLREIVSDKGMELKNAFLNSSANKNLKDFIVDKFGMTPTEIPKKAKEKVTGTIFGWKDKAQEAYESARESAQPYMDKAQEMAESAAKTVSDMTAKATETTTAVVNEVVSGSKLVDIGNKQLEVQQQILAILSKMQLPPGEGGALVAPDAEFDPVTGEVIQTPGERKGMLARAGGILTGVGRGLKRAGKGIWNANLSLLKGIGGGIGWAGGKLGTGLKSAAGYVPGMLSGAGHLAGGMLRGAGSMLGGFLGMNTRLIGSLFRGGKRAVTGTLGFLTGKGGNPYVDVFVDDENFDPNKPRLLGFKIREGAEDPSAATYFDTKGKPITSAQDIKTPVVSADGKTTYISETELGKLCDREKKKLGRSRIGRMVGGALSLAGSLLGGLGSGISGAFKAIRNIGRVGKNLVTGAAKLGFKGIVGGLKGIFSPIFGDIFDKSSLIKRKDLQEVVGDKLEEIYVLLYDRLGDNSSGFGDTDGDGIRDGSYEDYKKKKAEREAAREKKKAEAGDKKDENDPTKKGGWLAKLTSLFGGKKDEDEDDDGMSLTDIAAAKDLGGWAKGKLGKAGKWLGKGGKTLLGKAGGLIAKGGTMAGGALMSTSAGAATMGALSTAGTAVAGAASSAMGALGTAGAFLATNPVGWAILGAAAVGGAIWYFTDSKTEDKWQEIRGELYGVDGKKYDGEIEDLEKEVRNILLGKRGPLTEDEIIEFAEDFDFIDDGVFGLGGHSKDEIKKRAGYFQEWLSKRFIPVYAAYHKTVNFFNNDDMDDKPDPDDIPNDKQEEAQQIFREEANKALTPESKSLAPTEDAYKNFISKSEAKTEPEEEAKSEAEKALSGTELLEKADEADKKAQEEEEEETTSENTSAEESQPTSFLDKLKSGASKLAGFAFAPAMAAAKFGKGLLDKAVAVDKKLLTGMKDSILALATGSIAGGILGWVRDKIDSNPFKKKLLEYLGIPEDFKYMPALKRLQNEYLSMVKGERDPITEDELAKFAKGFGLVDQGFLSIFGGQGEAEIKSRTEFFIAWYRSRFAPVYTTYLNVVNVYSSTGDSQEMTDPHPENIPEDKLKNALEDFDNLAQQDLRSNDHAEDLAPTEEAYEEWYAKVHVLDETQETEATRERKETPLEWGKKVLSHTLFGKMLLGASDVTKSALEKLGVIDRTENRETEDEEDTSFVDKVKNAFSTAVSKVKNFVRNPFESIKNLFSSDDNKSGAPDNGEADSSSQSGSGYTSTDTGSGGAVATPVSVPEGDMQTNARLIYKALLEAGCTPEGAAGLLGNLRAESGLKAAIVQRGMGHTDAGFTAMLDELVRSGKNKAELTAIMKKKPYASVGYGLAQWTTAARKAGLILKAREKGTSVADINTQVEFLIDELKGGGYKKVWDALTSAKSVDDASTVVLKKFEAPADQGPATVAKRAGYGKGLFELLSKEINPEAQADLDKDAISAQNTDATSSSGSSNTSTSSSGSTTSSDTGTSGSGSYDSSQSSSSSGSVSTSGGDTGGLPSADGTSTSDSAGGTGESGDNSPIDPRLAGALSQYVVPKDKSVNLSGLDKKFQARLAAAAKEYQERTGKKLVVNEAKRDPKHQAELWVRGRILHEPGIHTPAKPPEKTTITYKGRQYDVPGSGRKNQHIQGAAIDVPARSGVAAVFDPIAQKYGLGRPWPQKDPPHFQVVDGSKPVGEFDGTSNEAPPADSSAKEGAPTQVEEMQKALDQKANEALTEDTPTPQETQVAEARADAEEKAADTVNQKFEKIPDKELAATDNQPVTDASTSAGTPTTIASESPLKQQMAETITPEKAGAVGSPTEDAHLGELKLQTQLLSELRDTIKSYIDNKLNNSQEQDRVINPATPAGPNQAEPFDSQSLVNSLAQMFAPGSPVIAAIAKSIEAGGNTQSPAPRKPAGERITMGTPINTRRQTPTYS